MKYVNETMGPVLRVPDPAEPWKEKLIANPFLDSTAKTGSFEEYVRGHYLDTYLREIRRMVADRTLPIGKSSREVPEPDDIFVDEISIMNIQFGMECLVFDPEEGLHREYPPGYPFTVRMRANVKASITVSEVWGHTRLADKLSQWYQVDGHAVFYPDSQEFFPVENAAIYDKDTPPMDYPLTETLAPVIGTEKLDPIAYRILDSFYREALDRPVRVRGKVLAARLKLNIMNVRLSADYSRFGLLVLRDCYLLADGVPTFIPARTILIDREACRKKRGGRTGWVILHECIHYLMHRPFYEAQRLYNRELACLCCGMDIRPDRDSDLYWMEWQAEHFPARLMIPAYTARKTIEDEVISLRRRFPQADEASIYQKLIPVIADLFNTSKQCTEIRMEELGCTVGDVAGRVVDNPPEPEAEPAGRPGNGPFYSVTIREASEGADRKLRKALGSGMYIFADSRFCLNSPEYIGFDTGGMPHLTDYAISHEEECCLPFWRHKDVPGHDPAAFHMDEITGTVITCGSEEKVRKKTVFQAYPEMKEVIEGLPASVGGTLKAHMERLDVTIEDLEYLSGVSERTIKNIRSNNCPRLEMRYFVAICIGLKLEPPYSLDLIRKTRFQFNAGRESTMYLLLLTSMYWAGIDACNAEMEANGFSPLTGR